MLTDFISLHAADLQIQPKLMKIAQTLIAQETLEGEKLESLFSETTPKPTLEPAATSTPAETTTKTKTKPTPKEIKVTPPPLPKQAPAALD